MTNELNFSRISPRISLVSLCSVFLSFFHYDHFYFYSLSFCACCLTGKSLTRKTIKQVRPHRSSCQAHQTFKRRNFVTNYHHHHWGYKEILGIYQRRVQWKERKWGTKEKKEWLQHKETKGGMNNIPLMIKIELGEWAHPLFFSKVRL